MVSINLLPWRVAQREEHHKKLLFWFFLFFIPSLVIILFFYGELYYFRLQLLENNKLLTIKIKHYDQQRKEINNIFLLKKRIIENYKIMQNLYNYSKNTINLFARLSRISPLDLNFERLERSGNKIKINGITANYNTVMQFMQQISKSRAMRDPVLISMAMSAKSVYEFQLSFQE